MNRIINHNLTQTKLTEIGEINMVKIPKEAYAFAETLKADGYKQGHREQISIKTVKIVDTQYGKKYVATLNDDRQMFLNAFSLQNLVDKFGDETEKWSNVTLWFVCELSERTQGKKTLVIETEEAVKSA